MVEPNIRGESVDLMGGYMAYLRILTFSLFFIINVQAWACDFDSDCPGDSTCHSGTCTGSVVTSICLVESQRKSRTWPQFIDNLLSRLQRVADTRCANRF